MPMANSEEEDDDRFLAHAILEVVQNQLRDGDPPETRQTFDRLRAQGIDGRKAKRLIACVVEVEMRQILKEKKPFNRDRFVRMLAALPKLPEVE